jgi:hypothetical protein
MTPTLRYFIHGFYARDDYSEKAQVLEDLDMAGTPWLIEDLE